MSGTPATPSFISELPDEVDVNMLGVGASLLGLPVLDHQMLTAAVLEARGPDGKYLYRRVAVQQPRRSSKTTSIWEVLVARCLTIPGYRVLGTAQDGVRASSILRGVMELLEGHGFQDSGYGRCFWSNGQERVQFSNGSVIWTVSPKPSVFRSQSADVLVFDEAGELDADQAAPLLAAALPLQDTRENPQVVVAGTPGDGRAGLLWESLEAARAGKPGRGAIDYSARDDEEVTFQDEDGNHTLNVELLERVHPGIGTLTTIETMQERLDDLGPLAFAREYAGRWPLDSTTSALDPVKWADARTDPSERPDRVGIAFDCAVDGSSATIAYAWRVDGCAFVEVVAHRPGTSWVPTVIRNVAGRHPRVPIAYDSIGANLDPGQQVSRLKPAPKVERITMRDVMGSTQRFVSELADGRLRHFGQADLDAAVANARFRDVANSGRAFGAKHPKIPINPLVACALALWSYDKGKDRARLTIAI